MENQFIKYQDNDLYIETTKISDLATKYGTPLYVLSESFLIDRLQMMKEAFLDKYDNVKIIYASKALSMKYIYQMLDKYGFEFDVCSDGEIFSTLNAGVNANKLYFHGSNKTWDEIEVAVKTGINTIIIDNIDEIVRVSTVAQQYGVVQNVLIRIVPQIKAGENAKIQTGNIGQKFGIQTHDESYLKAIQTCIDDPNLNFQGIHTHIGSQIQNIELYIDLANTMMNFVEIIQQRLGVVIEVLDLGGGFGIEYANTGNLLAFSEVVDTMMKIIESKSKKLGITRPQIIIEPGRYIVGPAGITIYTVTGVKEISGIKTYVHVDGGMTDNIRPSLYGAKYSVLAANKLRGKSIVSIAGHGCESGDVLAEEVELNGVSPDDYLVFLQTGAYNYSMASNYNSMRKPAIVVVKGENDKLVVKRQTFEQLLENEI